MKFSKSAARRKIECAKQKSGRAGAHLSVQPIGADHRLQWDVHAAAATQANSHRSQSDDKPHLGLQPAPPTEGFRKVAEEKVGSPKNIFRLASRAVYILPKFSSQHRPTQDVSLVVCRSLFDSKFNVESSQCCELDSAYINPAKYSTEC